MTDNTQSAGDTNVTRKDIPTELDEIEQVIRSVLTPNSYIVPQEGIELTKALIDWHNKQVEEVLDRIDKGIERCNDGCWVTIDEERNKLKERDDERI